MAYGLRSGAREGFQDGFVYKILSMKDKKGVMEVENASIAAGARIITIKKFTGAPSQKFVVARQESGGFQVSSVNISSDPESTKQCWDFLPHDGLLIQNDLGCAMNQVWVAEEIIPNSKICIVKSKDDGRCLKNMGKNNQVMLVPEDKKDKATHWRLEPTY